MTRTLGCGVTRTSVCAATILTTARTAIPCTAGGSRGPVGNTLIETGGVDYLHTVRS